MERTPDLIRTEIGAPDLSSIEVTRAPLPNTADPKIVEEVAPDAAHRPRFVARWAARSVLLSPGEYRALLEAGATER
jgi:hypothetical protein